MPHKLDELDYKALKLTCLGESGLSWLKCYKEESWEQLCQQLRVRVVSGREAASWGL